MNLNIMLVRQVADMDRAIKLASIVQNRFKAVIYKVTPKQNGERVDVFAEAFAGGRKFTMPMVNSIQNFAEGVDCTLDALE